MNDVPHAASLNLVVWKLIDVILSLFLISPNGVEPRASQQQILVKLLMENFTPFLEDRGFP